MAEVCFFARVEVLDTQVVSEKFPTLAELLAYLVEHDVGALSDCPAEILLCIDGADQRIMHFRANFTNNRQIPSSDDSGLPCLALRSLHPPSPGVPDLVQQIYAISSEGGNSSAYSELYDLLDQWNRWLYEQKCN